jgi:hypothetical protein
MNFTMPYPHTPEPWSILGNEHAYTIVAKGCVIADVFPPDPECAGPSTEEEAEANAARIVKCVNAMAGIERPEDIYKDIQNMINWINDECNEESQNMAETWWAKYPKRNG